MSKKCKAFSASKLGLEPANNRKAFYAGWDAAIEQAEKQEPVGYFSVNDYGNWEQNESNYGTPLYTAPRQWVGLTDEERRQIALDDPIDWVAAIEAKLKEKNIG